MAVYLDRVGAESPETERRWEPRDCSLYALAVGAGFAERRFTLDTLGDALLVYPTFALTIMSAESAAWPDPAFGAGEFDLHAIVLGEQELVVHRPLAPSGSVGCVSRLAGIYDKGSGAVVSLQLRARDLVDGGPVFTATADLFVIGEGGFGGDRGPMRRAWEVHGAPDHTLHDATSAVQSLIYRHAGNDANPVHVDAEFAREAGFDGPILTGQNSLGFACRAIVTTVTGGDPAGVRSVRGRFRAPAYNGDVLTTEIWEEDGDADGSGTVRFRVVSQRGDVVVDHGAAEVS
jgi:acyl dehydratase